MSERSGFFNAEIDSNGQYDRTYKAEQFAEYFSAFIGNGVYITPASQLKVIPVGNELAIYISVGNAYINGYFYANDDKIYRKLSNPNGVNPRIDRVVLRLNFKTRKISVDILEGAAASNPSAKGITRSQDVYELALADVYVASNAITVTEANITDLRNNSLMCGYVKGVVDQIDTTNLFSQFQNSFDAWFTNIKSQLSGDVAANLQRQIDENRERLSFNANENNATNLKDTLEAPMLVTNATRNLLNPTLQTTTQNGITCTNNGDGTYTLNGTATEKSTFQLLSYGDKSSLYKRIVGKNVLFLNGGHKPSSKYRILFNVSNSDYTKWESEKYDGDSFVVPSGYEIAVVDIHVNSGTTVNNLVVKPMITFDLDATNDDFVPYSGYEIKSCGKNLLDVSKCTNGKWLSPTDGSLIDGDYYYVSDFIPIKSGVHYVSSADVQIGYSYDESYYCIYDSDKNFVQSIKLNDHINFDSNINGYLRTMLNKAALDKNIQIEEGSTATDFEPYTGETITVTNDTESPAFGLKSHKGITNIISQGNVEVTYATSKSGKGFLESLLANSNIKDELDAKIKENTNQINANKQQLTTVNGQITKLQQDQSSTKETVDAHTTTLNESVLPELSSLIDNVVFKEEMNLFGVDNKLNLKIVQEGLFITKGAMTSTSNTRLIGCVVRSVAGATITTEPVTFARFDMNGMFKSGLIDRAYFQAPIIALPGESAVAKIKIMNEDQEVGARTIDVAIVGVQSTNIQASVPFMINNLEIIAIRHTQSASQYSLRHASTNEISLMSLDDEVESDVYAANDEQFVYDEETLALMEKLDNDPNWTRIIFKN